MINFDIFGLSNSCFFEQKNFFFLRPFFPLIQFRQMIQFNGVECEPCFSPILTQLISFLAMLLLQMSKSFFLLFLFLLGGAKVRENEIQYQFKAEEGVIED